jgi:hypothetical protein
MLENDCLVTLLDATAQPMLPVVNAVLADRDEAPAIVYASACDGAPVKRTWLRGPVTRRRIGGGTSGLLDPDVLPAMLKMLFDRVEAQHGLKVFCLATFRTVETAIAAVTDPDPQAREGHRAALRKYTKDEAARDALLAALAWLEPWRGKVVLLHYGNTRGYNHVVDAGITCVCTFGDPWTPPDDCKRDADFLGGTDGLDLGVLRVAAELEQALGRLRACRRTEPCVQIHMGGVRPGGFGFGRGPIDKPIGVTVIKVAGNSASPRGP